MGPASAGKSTILAELAPRLGWRTLDGDTLHPAANVAKMAAGVPLTDADRGPWLDAIAAWIGAAARDGEASIVACSALRRRYRDRLRATGALVRFVHLVAPPDVLAARIADRAGHFMPPGLLDSQLATLEPLAAGEGLSLDATRPPAAVAEDIVAGLGLLAPGVVDSARPAGPKP